MSWVEILFICLGIFLGVGLLAVLLIPTRKKKRNRISVAELTKEQKDWKETSVRLEKHIHTLRQKIEEQDNQLQHKEKQLFLEKVKTNKLQDRMNQVTKWQMKEEDTYTKMSEEFKTYKKELEKMQELYAKEHGTNIAINRELQQLKGENKELFEQRTHLQVELTALKDKNDKQRQEMNQLRQENAELKKKQDGTSWISKNEYLTLERQLKEKEKQLERLNREMSKESG